MLLPFHPCVFSETIWRKFRPHTCVHIESVCAGGVGVRRRRRRRNDGFEREVRPVLRPSSAANECVPHEFKCQDTQPACRHACALECGTLECIFTNHEYTISRLFNSGSRLDVFGCGLCVRKRKLSEDLAAAVAAV